MITSLYIPGSVSAGGVTVGLTVSVTVCSTVTVVVTVCVLTDTPKQDERGKGE